MNVEKQIDDLHEALASTESELSDAKQALKTKAAALEWAVGETNRLTEALARVEAERNELRFEVMTYSAQFDTAQAQLAEVLYILDQHRVWTGMGWEQLPVPVHAVEKIRSKLAQAEQQQAQSPMAKIAEGLRQKAADEWASHPSNTANQEAQGAQAGDERTVFEKAHARCNLRRRDDGLYENTMVEGYWSAWQKRAALATQPAAIKLPQRKPTDHLPAEYKTMTPTRASIESYNRALDDVAALNAVRGAEHE